MYATKLFLVITSVLSTIVSAGPHARGLDRRIRRVVHRRHHTRRSPEGAILAGRGGCDEGTAVGTVGNLVANATTPETYTLVCTEGDWQCSGISLQVCDHDAWVTLANCTGSNIVCSSSGAVGCIWATTPTAVSAGQPASSTSTTSVGDDDDTDCDDDDIGTETIFTTLPASTGSITATTTIGQGLIATGNATTSKTKATGVTTTTAAFAVATGVITNATSLVNSTANATSTSTLKSGQTKTTSTLVGTALSTALPTGTAVANTTVAPSVLFSAPHWVIYADNWITAMPSLTDMTHYNRFILAFWMSNAGAVDNAQAWAWFTPAYRAQILAQYHAAGIAVMVSAFGSTDAPTSWGMDPTQTAQNLAAWVIEYGLDGVDIDYEDMSAMNSNRAEAWLITFQAELRRLLPSPYLISHAPVAPWFTSANDYASGAYVKIHQEVGNGIDFYNVQFYNQGHGVYEDCTSLITDSGNDWPSTSVMELNWYAKVPLEKIVLGKPLDSGAADNGYMTPAMLSQCVTQAQALGWNAGVMFWEWTSQAPSVMATVRS